LERIQQRINKVQEKKRYGGSLGLRQPSGIVLKKKTFSHRSRKPPNLYSTYT